MRLRPRSTSNKTRRTAAQPRQLRLNHESNLIDKQVPSVGLCLRHHRRHLTVVGRDVVAFDLVCMYTLA